MRRLGCQARLQLEAHRLVLLRALVKLLGLSQTESPSSLALRLLPAFPARGVEVPHLWLPRALVKPLGLALLHTALPLAAGEQGNGVRVAGELPLHQRCTMCSMLPASHIGSCGPAILRLLPRPLLCRRAERLRRASPCALI